MSAVAFFSAAKDVITMSAFFGDIKGKLQPNRSPAHILDNEMEEVIILISGKDRRVCVRGKK